MKSITISICLMLVLAINSNAQNCINTSTLSGVGGQSAQSLIKNECSYLWGNYGYTKQSGLGMSHSFTVDGHTKTFQPPNALLFYRRKGVLCHRVQQRAF